MEFKRGDIVEYGFVGLADVVSREPFKHYGRMCVQVEPLRTDQGIGGINPGLYRTVPVADLKHADMTQWEYCPKRNLMKRVLKTKES